MAAFALCSIAARQDGEADLATTQAECAPADSLRALLPSGPTTKPVVTTTNPFTQVLDLGTL